MLFGVRRIGRDNCCWVHGNIESEVKRTNRSQTGMGENKPMLSVLTNILKTVPLLTSVDLVGVSCWFFMYRRTMGQKLSVAW